MKPLTKDMYKAFKLYFVDLSLCNPQSFGTPFVYTFWK
jgi:hypothetical protein